tara:strand:- start:906 stop:1676 length:771 start_codon:yes stop_codon:yes gene_type:complete
MKNIILLTFTCFTFLNCSDTKKGKQEAENQNYPKDLSAVFEAHGGKEKWDAMQTLSYDLGKGADRQSYQVDLKSRMDKTEAENFTMGFDGAKVWLVQDSAYYKPERARFTHDLMFYFYAMPFVLGDPGITYSKADPLQFEDNNYPGIKIAFDDGVGESSKDEYILYYDAQTSKMQWLAYTATFGDAQKSTKFSYIKYNDWQSVNGILLPQTLQWYSLEDGKPTSMRNEMKFDNVSVSDNKIDAQNFQKPENGIFTD